MSTSSSGPSHRPSENASTSPAVLELSDVVLDFASSPQPSSSSSTIPSSQGPNPFPASSVSSMPLGSASSSSSSLQTIPMSSVSPMGLGPQFSAEMLGELAHLLDLHHDQNRIAPPFHSLTEDVTSSAGGPEAHRTGFYPSDDEDNATGLPTTGQNASTSEVGPPDDYGSIADLLSAHLNAGYVEDAQGSNGAGRGSPVISSARTQQHQQLLMAPPSLGNTTELLESIMPLLPSVVTNGGAKKIPHQCKYDGCNKTFTRKSDMARHEKIHSGVRPFACEYEGCGRAFIQRSALTVHSRVHTGDKPFICEYPGCNTSFGDSSSLARHRRTHTGRRPYRCEDPACDKTFTRRTTLTNHMRTHDPNWQPDPKVKYIKSKRQRLNDTTDDAELAEGVRTLSTLLAPGTSLPIVQAAAAMGGSPYSGGILGQQRQSGDGSSISGQQQVIVDANTLAAAIAQAQRVNGSSGDGDYASEDVDGEGADGGDDEEIDELAEDDDDNIGRSATAREAEIALLEYLRGIGPKTSGIRGEGREGQSEELAYPRGSGEANTSNGDGVNGAIEPAPVDGLMSQLTMGTAVFPSQEPSSDHLAAINHPTLVDTVAVTSDLVPTSPPIAIDNTTTYDKSGESSSDVPETPSIGTESAEESIPSMPSPERPLKRKR